MSQVAILGCGPAGLLAAHAVARQGHTPHVYSRDAAPSPVPAGVFLQQAIPGLCARLPDGMVAFRKLGEERGYAAKVYGDPHTPTSWRKYAGLHRAWRMDRLYEQLWRTYSGAVRPLVATGGTARGLLANYPLVASTVPLQALCERDHSFPSRPTWYQHGAPTLVGENEGLYSGHNRDPWFRASDLFGTRVREYAGPDEEQADWIGIKVQPTDCTCHPKLVRLGRWGTWTPGVLLHHAFRRMVVAVGGL